MFPIGENEIKACSENINLDKAQSYLQGRVAVLLPTNEKYSAGWQALGIEFINDHKSSFLAKAFLPEGWGVIKTFTDFSDEIDITIIDDLSQKQVRVWMKTGYCTEEDKVNFFTLDLNKKSIVSEESESTCLLNEIIKAIESWGKLEAILQNDAAALSHTFIVSFKQPIKIATHEEGMKVNLTGGHEIRGTPFCLRTTYTKPRTEDNIKCRTVDKVILSEKMMAFDIRPFVFFNAWDLWETRKFVPDKRFNQIKDELGEHAEWNKIKEKLDTFFTESDRTKKLLEWVEKSGLSILEKGLCKSGFDRMGKYSPIQIIDHYMCLKESSWELIYKRFDKPENVPSAPPSEKQIVVTAGEALEPGEN